MCGYLKNTEAYNINKAKYITIVKCSALIFAGLFLYVNGDIFPSLKTTLFGSHHQLIPRIYFWWDPMQCQLLLLWKTAHNLLQSHWYIIAKEFGVKFSLFTLYILEWAESESLPFSLRVLAIPSPFCLGSCMLLAHPSPWLPYSL